MNELSELLYDIVSFFTTVKVLAIVWVILGFIFRIVIAYNFKLVAEEKGYQRARFFWLPFLTGVIGALIVVALPDRASNTAQEGSPVPQLVPAVQVPSAPTKQIPVVIKQPETQQEPRVEERTNATPNHSPRTGYFFCPVCGTEQKANREVCFMCGIPFKKE